MHLFGSSLVATLIFSLHLRMAQAQYDDEPTASRLNLEDLEGERQQRHHLQLFIPLSLIADNKYFTHSANREIEKVKPERHGDDEQVENAGSSSLPATDSLLFTRGFHVENRYRSEPSSSRAPSASYSLSNHITGAANNDKDDNGSDDADAANDFPLLQPIKSSVENSGEAYNFKQTPSVAFQFVSHSNHGTGSSAGHREANVIVTNSYQQRQQLPQTSDSHLHQQLLQHQRQEPSYNLDASTLPVVAVQHVGSGIQYLARSSLRETAANSIGYGDKPAPDHRLRFTGKYAHAMPQSNQLAYAPQRAESATLTAPTLPFPPSFVSITTHRPSLGAVDAVELPVTSQQHFAPGTRPDQQILVPDFFSQRQPKSLFDSYIPSWVVNKLLQHQ